MKIEVRQEKAYSTTNPEPFEFAAFGHFFERKMAEIVSEAELEEGRKMSCFAFGNNNYYEKVEVNVVKYIGKRTAFIVELSGDIEGNYLGFFEDDGELSYTHDLSSKLADPGWFTETFERETHIPIDIF